MRWLLDQRRETHFPCLLPEGRRGGGAWGWMEVSSSTVARASENETKVEGDPVTRTSVTGDTAPPPAH